MPDSCPAADEPFGDGPRGRLHQWMFEQPEENAAAVADVDLEPCQRQNELVTHLTYRVPR